MLIPLAHFCSERYGCKIINLFVTDIAVILISLKTTQVEIFRSEQQEDEPLVEL